jgi:hypothetical protein
MKRSYVVEQIEKLITWQRQDLDNGSDFEDANKILEMLEDFGMLPPYDASVDDEENGNEWEKE